MDIERDSRGTPTDLVWLGFDFAPCSGAPCSGTLKSVSFRTEPRIPVNPVEFNCVVAMIWLLQGVPASGRMTASHPRPNRFPPPLPRSKEYSP
jgi:hypothetical protein